MVIEAALKAMIPGDLYVPLLQPEPTAGRQQGWCGVFEWCRQYHRVEGGNLEDNTLLTARRLDLLVLHLDSDVAEKGYTDCSKEIAAAAAALGALPCVDPCPPPCPPVQPPADALAAVLRSWLSPIAIGPRTVICIPSKAIESWVAAALPDDSGIKIQGDIECDPDIPARLEPLRNKLAVKRKRIGQEKRKRSRDYAKHAPRITAEWSRICERCSQARRFHDDLLSAIAYLDRCNDSSR
ncbi:hypothetical protein [uncultured Thiodictyon sp.]|uniref:hypothetical protein n=1 Tax=uncultured Thiodictyon sp. TaxID=1846217 RepID=UPI0025CCD1C8|nr:hypothetical protein [uncultured Thiodictyon sp.]